MTLYREWRKEAEPTQVPDDCTFSGSVILNWLDEIWSAYNGLTICSEEHVKYTRAIDSGMRYQVYDAFMSFANEVEANEQIN